MSAFAIAIAFLLLLGGRVLTAAIGALLTLLGAAAWKQVAPFALAIAAGTFLHIAEVDLIPTIIATDRPRGRRAEAVVAFAVGVAVVATLSWCWTSVRPRTRP